MKTLAFLFVLFAVALTPPAALRAQETPVVSFDLFYNSLEPYGDWLYLEDYGYCFRPQAANDDADWRPYSDGFWTETDAGWTWVSEEDFGWACYHYGRWVRAHDQWLWVPGYEWAPAWVSWRRGGDYVGWAPLPPEATWEEGVDFDDSVDVTYDIGPTYYNFIPIAYFGSERCRPHLIPRDRNVTVINLTTNITHIRWLGDSSPHRFCRVYNGGPDFDDINRHSERKIRRLKLEENDDRRGGSMRGRINESALRVFAPRVRHSEREVVPRNIAARLGRDRVDRGWKNVDESRVGELRRKFTDDARAKSPERQVRKALPISENNRLEDRRRGGARDNEREGRPGERRPGVPMEERTPGPDRRGNNEGRPDDGPGERGRSGVNTPPSGEGAGQRMPRENDDRPGEGRGVPGSRPGEGAGQRMPRENDDRPGEGRGVPGSRPGEGAGQRMPRRENEDRPTERRQVPQDNPVPKPKPEPVPGRGMPERRERGDSDSEQRRTPPQPRETPRILPVPAPDRGEQRPKQDVPRAPERRIETPPGGGNRRGENDRPNGRVNEPRKAPQENPAEKQRRAPTPEPKRPEPQREQKREERPARPAPAPQASRAEQRPQRTEAPGGGSRGQEKKEGRGKDEKKERGRD